MKESNYSVKSQQELKWRVWIYRTGLHFSLKGNMFARLSQEENVLSSLLQCLQIFQRLFLGLGKAGVSATDVSSVHKSMY